MCSVTSESCNSVLRKADTVSPELERLEEKPEVHIEVVVLGKRDSVFVSPQFPGAPLNRDGMNVHPLNGVTGKTHSDAEKLAGTVGIEHGNLGAEVTENRLDDSFTGLPGRQTLT